MPAFLFPENTASTQKIRFWLSFAAGVLGFGEIVLVGGVAFNGNRLVQMVGFVMALTIGIGWLIWRWVIWQECLPRTELEWGIGLSVAAVGISLALSADPRQGLWRAGWLLACGVLFYFFISVLDSGFDTWGLLSGLAAVVTLMLLQAGAETLQWYRAWFEAMGGLILPPTQYRYTGILMANPAMALANQLVFVLLAAFRYGARPGIRIAAAVGLMLYGLALPFSSSRSGWLGLAAGCGAALLLWAWEKRLWRVLRGWSRIRMGLGALALIVMLLVAGLAAVQFLKVFASGPSHAGDPFGTSGRENFVSAALAMWKGAPWFGIGPGRYGLEYLAVTTGTPPGFWPAQAHNIVFQVLAEFGAVGLAAWLVLLVLAVRWCWQRYRQALPALQVWAGAILAGLVALFAQLLFDDSTSWMAVSVPFIFLLAWLGTVSQGRPIQRFTRVSLGWLTWPVSLLFVISGWVLWANQPFSNWMAAAQVGDWRRAAGLASESTWRDPDFHFYHSQAGLLWAWSWNSSKDPMELENARFHLTQALRLEPSASWNWANLAALDASAGDLSTAIIHMQKAAQLSPGMAVYALNLGRFYEQGGQFDLARISYRTAIGLNPGWKDLSFWTESLVRSEILTSFKSTLADDTGDFQQRAQQAFAAGRLDEADRNIALSRLMGEPEMYNSRLELLVAKARGDRQKLRQAQENLTYQALQSQRQVDLGVNFIYQAFISNLDGTRMSAVPGLMPWVGLNE